MMKRQAPYADASANRYAASQMQHMSARRMQHNARMNNFSGRPDSLSTESRHPYNSSRAEGQWQWDRDEPNASNPESSHLYSEGQGGNAAQSLYHGRMPDPKVDLEIQADNEPRLQSHEQDMEIGYEDKPSPLTFEGMEKKFLDEVMKLVKEQSEAEDAETARHKEKILEINTQYQEKLSLIRARHANQIEEILCKESQVRLHEYQQAGLGHHLTKTELSDPRGYVGAVAAETHRSYGTGQYDAYRERPTLGGGGRSQGAEARVPYPEGRVYNNTSARYY